jgi:hypothetical protein
MTGNDLGNAGVKDPDDPGQAMTPRQSLVELGRIRRHHFELERRHIDLVDRPLALQVKILAFDVNTSTSSKVEVSCPSPTGRCGGKRDQPRPQLPAPSRLTR